MQITNDYKQLMSTPNIVVSAKFCLPTIVNVIGSPY